MFTFQNTQCPAAAEQPRATSIVSLDFSRGCIASAIGRPICSLLAFPSSRDTVRACSARHGALDLPVEFVGDGEELLPLAASHRSGLPPAAALGTGRIAHSVGIIRISLVLEFLTSAAEVEKVKEVQPQNPEDPLPEIKPGRILGKAS